MDNLLELIYYDYQGVRKINDYSSRLVALYGSAHTISSCAEVEEKEPLTKQQISGGCQNKNTSCDGELSPMSLLHVKLGHASAKVIKWAVKHHTTLGLRVTYDQIKNAKLKF